MIMASIQEYNDFRNEVRSMDGELPPANIIIAGITGSGKSTLINAVFGKQKAKSGFGGAVTSKMEQYYEEGAPVSIWDTVGLELKPEVTEKTISDIKELIRKKSENRENKFDRIHTIWYCIQAVGSRIQAPEIEFISKMHKLGVPFIIVLTKCINKKGDIAFSESITKLLFDIGVYNIPIIRVLAEDWEIDEGMVAHKKGLQELIDVTAKNLESSIIRSFFAAQKIDKEMKRNEAEKIIIHYCNDAKKDFFNHIPIANIFNTSSYISKMFKEIGCMYNTQLSESDTEKIYKNTIGEWKGKLGNLLIPFPMGEEVENFFRNRVLDKSGFDNKDFDFAWYDKGAQLITWSGYSWIFAIEEFWDELIKAESGRARDEVIQKMIERLRNYMKNHQ